MFVLKGGGEKNHPNKIDIKSRLTKLQNGEIDFLILEKGDQFLQSIPSDANQFYMEWHSSKNNFYKHKDHLSYPETLILFIDFLEDKKKFLNKVEFWEEENVNKALQVGKKRGLKLAVFILLPTVIPMLIFSAIKSNQAWYSALPSALIIFIYFFGLFLAVPPITEKIIPNALEKISSKMRMPCKVEIAGVRSGYKFILKNKRDRNAFKFIILFIFEIVFIILFVFIIATLLALVIFLARFFGNLDIGS